VRCSKGVTSKNVQTKGLRGNWRAPRFGKLLKTKGLSSGAVAMCGFLKELPLKMSKRRTYGAPRNAAFRRLFI
jgi:hypothetical protein